jgi:hypothetical protein
MEFFKGGLGVFVVTQPDAAVQSGKPLAGIHRSGAKKFWVAQVDNHRIWPKIPVLMGNSPFFRLGVHCAAAIALVITYTANVFGASATFALDQSTQGSWKGTYGVDGFNIPFQGGAFPAYASVTFSGASQWVWNYGTSNLAGVQKPNGTDRIASCWYASDNYSAEINITDGKSHRVALYCLDWDAAGRRQSVTITDVTSGAVLNTQTVTAFSKGAWLVWDISGRVRVTVKALAGNAVASGLFFGGNPVSAPAPAQVAAPVLTPPGGTFSSSVAVSISSSTPGATIRYTLDGVSAPTLSSALYTGPVTLSATTTLKAKAFAPGMTDSAVTTATFTRSEPVAPPSSGGASATFITQDSTTQGNWKGAYGGDGFSIASLGGTLPAYAKVAFAGSATWVWNYNTSEIAGVQKISGTERIASCWYAPSSYSLDINLTDGQTHRVALYCLDWDAMGRQQTVSLLDPATGAVLNSRTLTGFQRGVWLVWEIKGRVTLKVASTVGNAVASGLFFGAASANPTPVLQVAAPVINPAGGTFSGPTTISISTATAGATIRYTTDGTTPGSASPIYTAPFSASTTVAVKAKGFKSGMTDSAVTSATFNISNPTAPPSNLPDLAGLPNRVFPSPDGLNTVQYAPGGKLGFIVWRDQQLIHRERDASGAWSETVVNNAGNVYKPLLTFSYYGLREEYRFQPSSILLYDAASQAHVFQGSGRNLSHYVRGSGGWMLTETIAASLASDNIATVIGAVGPNNVFHVGALSAGTSRNLTYASNKSGQWNWSTVSGITEAPLSYAAPTYAPRWLSLAVDSRNNAHIAFRTGMTLTYDAEGHPRAYSELKYASNASGQWAIALVQQPDDTSAEAANGATIAIASDDRPRIVSWYNDRGDGGSSRESRLYYHEPAAAGGWNRTVIIASPDGYTAGDGPKGTGFSPYIRFDDSGRPHVLFLDHASEHFNSVGQQEYAGNLRHAWWNGSAWSVETIYRQTGPLDRQIVYPAFALRGNQMAVTFLQRETQWNLSSFPPMSNSTHYFRFFTKTLP